MIPAVVADFARGLERAQRERRLKMHSRRWRPTATPVSSLGYRCDRRLVLKRVRPELEREIGEELASIFSEGDEHQESVNREMSLLGHPIIAGEQGYEDKDLEIRGAIDGIIEIPLADGADTQELIDHGALIRHGKLQAPAEIKSLTRDPPETAEAWRDNPSPMLRNWYAQLQGYLVLMASPWGFGFFKSKITGLWKIVPCALDYEYTEALLQRAERVRDHVRAFGAAADNDSALATLPPHIQDRSECNRCTFRDTGCFPADVPVDPVLLVDDAGFLFQLKRRHELDPLRKEYERLHKQVITARLKLTAGAEWVVGDAADGFLITRKITSNKQHRFQFRRLESQVGGVEELEPGDTEQ